MVGERIITSNMAYHGGGNHCNSLKNGTLYKLFCPPGQNDTSVDLNCRYFKEHPPHEMDGIPGLASGVFMGKCTKACADLTEYIGVFNSLCKYLI